MVSCYRYGFYSVSRASINSWTGIVFTVKVTQRGNEGIMNNFLRKLEPRYCAWNSCLGKRFFSFPERPYCLLSTPSLLFSRYWRSFAGHEANHSRPSCARVGDAFRPFHMLSWFGAIGGISRAFIWHYFHVPYIIPNL